jgi:hypothetical protein
MLRLFLPPPLIALAAPPREASSLILSVSGHFPRRKPAGRNPGTLPVFGSGIVLVALMRAALAA